MKRARLLAASLFLIAGVTAPAALPAAPLPQEVKAQARIYDKEHKDYHTWDDHENRAWTQFLTENHRKSHEFTRANSKEKNEYWNWRHDHPDGSDKR